MDGSELEQACFKSDESGMVASDDSVIQFVEKLKSHGPQDMAENDILIDFVTKATGRDADCPVDIAAVCCPDKVTRAAVHQTVRTFFPVQTKPPHPHPSLFPTPVICHYICNDLAFILFFFLLLLVCWIL